MLLWTDFFKTDMKQNCYVMLRYVTSHYVMEDVVKLCIIPGRPIHMLLGLRGTNVERIANIAGNSFHLNSGVQGWDIAGN